MYLDADFVIGWRWGGDIRQLQDIRAAVFCLDYRFHGDSSLI
jgi:hypothetical protein